MNDGNITYWDFIAEYLPNYYSDNRVLWSDICLRYLDDDEISEEDVAHIEKGYKNKMEVLEELKRIDKILWGEAIDAFYEKKFEDMLKWCKGTK